jgi:alkylation response protein AidB-like acyl-CoA dehydrogenase
LPVFVEGDYVELVLTDDQELFRATTRKFLASECALDDVRALELNPDGFDPAWWRQAAELGWTSMLVPEADGGGSLSGNGLLDLVLVAEEMGRMVSPGPLVPVNVVADAIARSGSPDQRAAILPGLVAGDIVATWAFAESGSRWDNSRLTTVASPSGDSFVLDGTKSPVEAGAQAQYILVTAQTDAGLVQLLVPSDAAGVTITPLEGLDLVRRFAEVRFEGVEVPGSAVVGAGRAEADVERQLQVAVSLQCAETVGAIDRVFEMTLGYVGDRHSFGRSVSSYQAIKHRFADMKLWLEACHGTATAAARAAGQDTEDAAELVSAAKSYIGPRATDIVQDCVQMHGGIGVTWEHDIHLYLRRVTVNRTTYGSPTDHRERIAVLLGL